MLPPRKLYKFSHSVAQGGYLYAHKTASGEPIKDRETLRKVLEEVAKNLELIDVTVKIYNDIFFLFFLMKPKFAPAQIIDSVQEAIKPLGNWHPDFLFDGVYDLQEAYVRNNLEKMGFDYDKG
jgi:hypothetical protein